MENEYADGQIGDLEENEEEENEEQIMNNDDEG